jgi:hypothetical protein
MTPTLRKIVFRLLERSRLGRFDAHVFSFIQCLFKFVMDSIDDIITILKTIGKVQPVDHVSSVAIASCLLRTSWLVSHTSPHVHAILTRFFGSVDPHIALEHILINVSIYHNQDPIDCAVILKETCAVMVDSDFVDVPLSSLLLPHSHLV